MKKGDRQAQRKTFSFEAKEILYRFMELYDQLASNEESQRMKAAGELVRKIVDGQKNGNAEKGTDLAYGLPRLVKGLSSGRESARLGFSITLTEVMSIRSFPDIIATS